MVNDEKRREVAAELRRQIGYMCERSKWYEDDIDGSECGNTAYRNIAASVERCGHAFQGNYIHICETLADLIDRPTTTRHGKFKTKYGRETPCCEVCGYSIGDMRWNYCPKCGAVITDAKR